MGALVGCGGAPPADCPVALDLPGAYRCAGACVGADGVVMEVSGEEDVIDALDDSAAMACRQALKSSPELVERWQIYCAVGDAHADEGAAGAARPTFSRSLRPSFDISRGTCAASLGQRLPRAG